MKIFLSYTRMDKAKVRKLYKKLSDKGFNPWIDVENILPGEDWEHSIINAIKESHFFLACLSRNSVNKRGFIRLEINKALEIWKQKLRTDIYLIPVRLEDCNVPKELEKFQRVDLFASGGFEMLLEALQVGMKRLKEEEYSIMEDKRKSITEFSNDELGKELVEKILIEFLKKGYDLFESGVVEKFRRELKVVMDRIKELEVKINEYSNTEGKRKSPGEFSDEELVQELSKRKAFKVGMERLKEEEAKIKESSNMEDKRKSPLELSVEELDRELIARSAQTLGHKQFIFRDKEGTPERNAIMTQVKKLYENPPPPNDALSDIKTWDLAKILIFKTRSDKDFTR